MSWTKAQFIDAAFEEIGFASYNFDLQPEQKQAALHRLDSMIASWQAMGLFLSYPLPESPDEINIDANSNVPDSANEAVYLNLAMKIAPMLGKSVPPETMRSAKLAYDALLNKMVKPVKLKMQGGYPLGAGNRCFDRNFTHDPEQTISVDTDNNLELH